MILLKKINKYYTRGSEIVHALREINLEISRGEFIAITGKSGSGKTTLLQILGLVDKASGGNLYFNGIDVSSLGDSNLSKIRREKIGFIFQQFHLIPKLSVFENIALPQFFHRRKIDKERIFQLLKFVHLSEKWKNSPEQLSGGEMQRVAIARALANNPELVLADEPTGNLDSENTERVLELLLKINYEGVTVIVVTHDMEVASRAQRIIRISDGRIIL